MKRCAYVAVSVLSLVIMQGTAWAQAATEVSTRKLLEVLEVRQSYERNIGQVRGMLAGAARASLGPVELTPAQSMVVDQSQAEIDALVLSQLGWERVEASFLDVYRSNFTADEMQAMLTFYGTEHGSAVARKMPLVVQSSGQIMQQQMSELSPVLEAMERTMHERLQELCKQEKTPNCPQDGQ